MAIMEVCGVLLYQSAQSHMDALNRGTIMVKAARWASVFWRLASGAKTSPQTNARDTETEALRASVATIIAKIQIGRRLKALKPKSLVSADFRGKYGHKESLWKLK